MNFKNHRTRYWLAGLAVLLVGMLVFFLVLFPVQPIVNGELPRKELPKVVAAVRHYRMQLFMEALRAKQWRKLPALLSVALGHPVAEVQAYPNTKNWVVTWGKKGSDIPCYFVMNNGTNWAVQIESTLISPTLRPPVRATAAK
jgi:hypothetical protein